MYLALLCRHQPKTLVLNGSNKQTEELEMAVQNGLCINIDAMDELDRIEAVCKRLGKDADIGIRLKLDLEPLAKYKGVAMHAPGRAQGAERQHQVGHVARADRGDHQARPVDEAPQAEGDALPPQPHVQRPDELRRDGAAR